MPRVAVRANAILGVSAAVCLAAAACAPAGGSPTAAKPAATQASATQAPAAKATTAKAAGGAADAEMAKYFEGKTITVTVGYNTGGGYDTMARMLAVHMPKHIPGNPKIVVENQAGSDSLVATQAVMRKKADGYSAVVGANFLDDEALGADVPGIELNNPPVILGTAYASWQDRPYFCTRSEVATSWEQFMARGAQNPLTMGMQTRGGWTEYSGTIIKLPVKIVYGYQGGRETQQAMDRKEIEATHWCHPPSIKREFPEWITSKFITPIADFEDNPERHAEFIREGGWPMPKKIEELVQLSDHHKQVLNTWRATSRSGGYLVSLPPGTPENVVTTLRAALKATAEDPGYVADMKQRELIAGFKPGDAMIKEAQDLAAAPDALKTDLKVLTGN